MDRVARAKWKPPRSLFINAAVFVIIRSVSKFLERNSRLYLKSARCHEVRAAEGRKEIVQRDFVRDVDSGESERHLRVFSTEKILGTHTEVEQVARRNPGRIGVVVLSTIRWNS